MMSTQYSLQKIQSKDLVSEGIREWNHLWNNKDYKICS